MYNKVSCAYCLVGSNLPAMYQRQQASNFIHRLSRLRERESKLLAGKKVEVAREIVVGMPPPITKYHIVYLEEWLIHQTQDILGYRINFRS